MALRRTRRATVMLVACSRVQRHCRCPLNGDPTRLDPMPLARSELDDLFSAAYEELRGLAASVSRDDPSATLNPTALVNEAYARLARSHDFEVASSLHFKRIAARAMRQVLVEAARRRNAKKRVGRHLLVTLDERIDADARITADVVLLDSALEELGALSERQAQVVELRFFGGLEVAEVGEVLGVSSATVARDWRAARAWLALELREGA